MNFISKDHVLFGKGEKIRDSEFMQQYGEEKILHSFYEDNEPDKYFKNLIILYKEKRIIQKLTKDGEKICFAYLEYMAKKTN